MYEVVDAALLRLAAGPVEPPDSWPDVATWDTADLVGWLRAVSTAPAFTDAIEVASPILADRISRMCERPDPGRRDVQRVVRATVKYVLRARTRATPFGLFAGVAPLRLGARGAVRLDDGRHHVRARVDASWMAAVLERLHRDRRLVRRLEVIATDLAVVRDGRLVLPTHAAIPSGHDPRTGASATGSAGSVGGHRPPVPSAGGTQEMSVRLTPAVAAVVELARVPVPFMRLTAQLAQQFPAPDAAIEAMLFALVDHQLLRTALHAPMTVTDPLTHLVDVLSAAADTTDLADADRDAPGSGDDLSAVLVALRDTKALLVEHDRADAAPLRRDLRMRAADRMRSAAVTDRQIGVDLRLDVDGALPAAVAIEAARAAEVMTRLSLPSDTSTPWGDYHRRFLNRYGPGALVGVQELLHGSDGLGYPAGYRDSMLPSPSGRRSAQSVRRDAALLDLAHRAAWDRLGEVHLAEDDLLALTGSSGSGGPVVEYAPARPHLEIRAEVHAASCAAIDRHEFTLAVLSVSRGVGTITGRFLDLLDPRDQERMRAAYAELPTLTTGALRAQVSCPPITASATTISRTPPLLPASIALAQPPATGIDPGDRIPLSDLAVSADTRGCYLVSVSRNRPIEPHLFGAVELVRVAHPILRFLAEISTAAAPVVAPFPWGPARELPYLPRIRHGRTVLTPARWRFRVTDLVGCGNLAGWRQRGGVPDRVLLGDDDRRLRLDLTEPAHRDILLDRVHRAGAVTVLEAPSEDAFGWIAHRPHEIVLPLAAAARALHPARPRPTAVTTGRPASDRAPTHAYWLSARLFGRPEQLTRVLVDHLAALLDDLARAHPRRGPGWWFLRHSDPEQHLRVRVPLSVPDAFGVTAEAIRAWSAPLIESGVLGRLEFDTYRAETGRFGDGAAMDAAHAVFAADSAAALTQLRLTGHHHPTGRHGAAGPDRTATTAASLLDLVTAFTGHTAEGRRWLLDHVPRSSARASDERDRTTRADTLALVGPHLQALAGGADVAAAWQRRARALAAYRTVLVWHGVDDPTVVLPDLLHLHHARTIGLSLESEHRCLHHARTAALAQLHRRVP